MKNWTHTTPTAKNEPVLDYRPDSPETKALKAELKRQESTQVDIPCIINGEEIRTGKTSSISSPHNHQRSLGQYHQAGPAEISKAIDGSQKAFESWSRMPAEERSSIFLKAAELISKKHRYLLNASTMLGQGKTCHQAEIDSACELIDFLRFNVAFQSQLYAIQPESGPGLWNRLQYRPLEGFVFAVTPFNFTAIAGNLPSSAALMGNTVFWKPASTAVHSAYHTMKIFEEAGLPPGVIQFVPGSGRAMGEIVLKDPKLAGIHFTGSTEVFQTMWRVVGENIANYATYPRVVGETGGKDFIFAHSSADLDGLTANIIRGAFEYQGQKCSAASRAYIPKSLWGTLKDRLIGEIQTLKMGDVADFSNFMGAVIDANSFNKIKGYLDAAKSSNDASILTGGNCDDSQGYFIEPTVIEAKTPKYTTMCEELFGPVITFYIYDDNKFEETLKVCDQTSPYGLTGCIWAQDRQVIDQASEALTHSAGNFYINNKPTGAVVGQQPFGGSRASGTNDKAGSLFNLLRWVSMRTVSETLNPPTNYRYPFLG